jgi:hypothetical protein
MSEEITDEPTDEMVDRGLAYLFGSYPSSDGNSARPKEITLAGLHPDQIEFLRRVTPCYRTPLIDPCEAA